jgi:hypothetical protein
MAIYVLTGPHRGPAAGPSPAGLGAGLRLGVKGATQLLVLLALQAAKALQRLQVDEGLVAMASARS